MIIKESITIYSTVEKVWNTFTDLTRWTQWNTVMSDVVCDDTCLVNGKNIACCFRPFLFPINVKIKIQEIIPFNRIVWSAQKKDYSPSMNSFFRREKKVFSLPARRHFQDCWPAPEGSSFLKSECGLLRKHFWKTWRRHRKRKVLLSLPYL